MFMEALTITPGFYGSATSSAICARHTVRLYTLLLHTNVRNVMLRFSHAGSRPVGLPAEYQSHFDVPGLITRTGEYAGFSRRLPRVLDRNGPALCVSRYQCDH